MTQKEKIILLQDLCARLLYKTKCHFKYGTAEGDIILKCIDGDVARFDYGYFGNFHIIIDSKYIKPYLRPMDSMTEEESEEFKAFHCVDEWHPKFYRAMCNLPNINNMINWLDKKMFDHRGLIPMGLALLAKEEMYKI